MSSGGPAATDLWWAAEGDPTHEFDAIADAVAVLDAVGTASAHLVGNSLGATVARAIAVLDPARVRSLTLVGPSFPADNAPDETRLPFEQWRVAREAGDIEAAVAVAREHWLGAGAQEARLRELVRRQPSDRPESEPLTAVAKEARRITAPTLVVVREQDTPLVVLGSQALAGLIPDARRQVLDGARHHPQEDDPEGFSRGLSEFVSGAEGVDW